MTEALQRNGVDTGDPENTVEGKAGKGRARGLPIAAALAGSIGLLVFRRGRVGVSHGL